MENIEEDYRDDNSVERLPSAVNNLILDYYKKFGKKRDLEQFFSLSTAQSDIRDPTGTFWRRMKAQNDSSDSGEKRSESSTELCRISIKCSIPEASRSQDKDRYQKSDSESPPIITEEAAPTSLRDSDHESVKSDDAQSQRSNEATFDNSINKPHSPTSSINSQRKLEWDSLADVGYANESDRKTSASSLSTLERLALKQQYSNNDNNTKHSELGLPTAHSTPLEENEAKCKGKKGVIKKTTRIYNKDVDLVELNVPHTSDTRLPQAISVNLSKHISFNVERDGGINIDNIKKNISVSPEKDINTDRQIQEKIDKEIQTSLVKNKDKSTSSMDTPRNVNLGSQKIPVVISLNTLRNRNRKKKFRTARRKLRNKKKLRVEKVDVSQEKSTEQLSEAESFEYMPGHIYNQNHLKINKERQVADNKSSLESSACLTTDSSKGSKHSFSKDLEKGIELLKVVLQEHNDDSILKKKLIKEVVQRLIKSRYRDDDSTTDFLSGLSFSSRILGLSEDRHTTSSTTDANHVQDKDKARPKKSILRTEIIKNAIPSTSQSAPNLPTASNSDRPVASNFTKPLFFSNTDSDLSSKEKNSSDIGTSRISSEELYKKYLEALRREQAYKKHLKDKETFFKQRLVSSESAIRQISQADLKTKNKLKSLIKDLTRNNYDDGSGDASKLEGHSDCNIDVDPNNLVNIKRSHSVFTLSSGNSSNQNRNTNMRKQQIQTSSKCSPKTDYSKNDHHYCCCPYHIAHPNVGFTDSSVQVNIGCDEGLEKKMMQSENIEIQRQATCSGYHKDTPKNIAKVVSDFATGDLKYVCVCSNEVKTSAEAPENFLVYKCSRLVNKGVQLGDTMTRNFNNVDAFTKNNEICSCAHKTTLPNVPRDQCNDTICDVKGGTSSSNIALAQNTKSSQTNVNLTLMLQRKSSEKSVSSNSSENCCNVQKNTGKNPNKTDCVTKSKCDNPTILIHEATRITQTEISIDPKISDPSLSDVNIIECNGCVKLIIEQYREVTKPNSEHNIQKRSSESDIPSSGESSAKPKPSPEVTEVSTMKEVPLKKDCGCKTMPSDKMVQCDVDYADVQSTNIIDKFTIPIQGTNMTLKVNLGTNDTDNRNVEPNNIETKSQGVVTIETEAVEKFTSLREDCTKGVQCDESNVFEQCNEKNDIGKVATPNISTQVKMAPNVCCAINTCVVNKNKYNTYPKDQQVIPRKPLLRTNTDINNLNKLKSIEFDLKKHSKTDIRDGKESKTTSTTETQTEKQSSGSSEQQFKTADEASTCDVRVPCEQKSRDPTSESDNCGETDGRDPLIDVIQGITKRYSKKDIERNKKKKCFKEIMNILNYLLDTEESTDDHNKISASEVSEALAVASEGSTSKVEKERKEESEWENKDESERENKDESKRESKDKCQKTEISETDRDRNCPKLYVDKGVQLSIKKCKTCKPRNTESSEIAVSTDLPTTSSDSPTCKVLNKIKNECEKYHNIRCKSHNEFKGCATSSSTSVNCNQCKRVHHCHCVRHKCKNHKSKSEKPKKKCVAYNLIIQTSDSVVSEEAIPRSCRPLKNIIVKVPSTRRQVESVPFKEMSAKIERNVPRCSPRSPSRGHRSRSLPNDSEISSTEEFLRKAQTFTVREYLERNRPDFVEKSSNRQNCLKVINETRPSEMCQSPYLKMVVVHSPQCVPNSCLDPCNMYCGGVQMSCNQCVDPYVQSEVRRIATDRNAKRQLLSLQLDREQSLSALTDAELRHFAKQLSEELRRKKVAPKFISEREMKKHSEKIYKSLPEVTQKKEQIKKENMKKTNLLMASIFKKNLQKKTLRGSVNLSNYSSVIKI